MEEEIIKQIETYTQSDPKLSLMLYDKIKDDVRDCLKELSYYIKNSGQLDRYWNDVQIQNLEAKMNSRKL